jgi:response regulator of citrate/malate metabolism
MDTAEETHSSDESNNQSLLSVFDDTDSRAIMEATSEESRSASELAEICNLPLSTAYRKVDQLTDVGMLQEQTRIRQTGKHTSEYRRALEGLSVEIHSDGSIDVIVSPRGEGGNASTPDE